LLKNKQFGENSRRIIKSGFMSNEKKNLSFGGFRLDVETGELFDKSGELVKLQQQPTQVLTLLATKAGQLVTREEIQKSLWSDDTFVDFEQGVNYCIKQIRIALDDDAKTPKFVETLPRRGYRFIAEVESLNGHSKPTVETVTQTTSTSVRNFIYISAVILILFLGTAIVWNFAAKSEPIGITSRNPEAQDAFLKGKHLFQKGDAESIKSSLEFFDQAIHADEQFANAYVARADAFYQLGKFGQAKTNDAFPKAKADVTRAIAINPKLSDGYAILGSIAFRYDWDFPQAEQYFKKAIEINPNSANAHHDYAWFLASQSRFEEAINSIEKAQKIEPTSVRTNIDVGWIYARARRYDQAIAEMKRTLDLEPNNEAARQCLECAYLNKGQYAESVENGLVQLKKFGASEDDLAKIRQVSPKEGVQLIEEWRLRRMESGLKYNIYIPAYFLALQYAAVGDKETAFKYLEKGYAERDSGIVMMKVEQVWDKFRDEPKYQEMLKKIGLN
jgi:DNA-binding winged helix-turn-helix (wHTH) protein/Tfp pilus assembly protein PilF